ncbi:MAG: DUF3006 domain-containing protein [Acutalibacteraceae bacterium]
MNKWSIDRFEERFAVLISDAEETRTVLRTVLPPEAKEGEIVLFSDGRWVLLPEETEQLRRELFSLQESLFDE